MMAPYPWEIVFGQVRRDASTTNTKSRRQDQYVSFPHAQTQTLHARKVRRLMLDREGAYRHSRIACPKVQGTCMGERLTVEI